MRAEPPDTPPCRALKAAPCSRRGETGRGKSAISERKFAPVSLLEAIIRTTLLSPPFASRLAGPRNHWGLPVPGSWPFFFPIRSFRGTRYRSRAIRRFPSWALPGRDTALSFRDRGSTNDPCSTLPPRRQQSFTKRRDHVAFLQAVEMDSYFSQRPEALPP